jgi:hypothetical protein
MRGDSLHTRRLVAYNDLRTRLTTFNEEGLGEGTGSEQQKEEEPMHVFKTRVRRVSRIHPLAPQELLPFDLPEVGGKITHARERHRHLHQPIRHRAAAGGD